HGKPVRSAPPAIVVGWRLAGLIGRSRVGAAIIALWWGRCPPMLQIDGHRLGLFDTCLEQRRCRAWRRPEGRCWTNLDGGNRGVCRRGCRRRSDYGDSADSLEVPAPPELKHRGVTPVK